MKFNTHNTTHIDAIYIYTVIGLLEREVHGQFAIINKIVWSVKIFFKFYIGTRTEVTRLEYLLTIRANNYPMVGQVAKN